MADQIQIDGAGVQLVYDGPDQVQVNGLGVQLIYDLVGNVQLHGVGVQLVYSDVPVEIIKELTNPPELELNAPVIDYEYSTIWRRKFPVPQVHGVWESQPGRRKFPTVR